MQLGGTTLKEAYKHPPLTTPPEQVQVLYAVELTSGVAVAGIERRTGWQKLWPFARSARAPGRGPLRPRHGCISTPSPHLSGLAYTSLYLACICRGIVQVAGRAALRMGRGSLG